MNNIIKYNNLLIHTYLKVYVMATDYSLKANSCYNLRVELNEKSYIICDLGEHSGVKKTILLILSIKKLI